MSGQSFNLYFNSSSLNSWVFFPKIWKLPITLSHSVINSGSLSVRGSFRVLFYSLWFGVGRKSRGTSLCIPLLNEIRAFDSKDGSSRILPSNLVVSFDIHWSTVQSSFCAQLLGIDWDICFCARVVSFLSITLVLGVRVEIFLHLIFVWNQVIILNLFIGLYKKIWHWVLH